MPGDNELAVMVRLDADRQADLETIREHLGERLFGADSVPASHAAEVAIREYARMIRVIQEKRNRARKIRGE
jgi:hypothetical protein